MKRLFAATTMLIAGIGMSGAAFAGMAEDFAQARLTAFGTGDVEALVAGYLPDAVIVTPGAVIDTPDGRRQMLESIVAEFSQPGVAFELLSQTVAENVVEFTWKAETPQTVYAFGTDTYVLDGGQIRIHTVAMSAMPK